MRQLDWDDSGNNNVLKWLQPTEAELQASGCEGFGVITIHPEPGFYGRHISSSWYRIFVPCI